MDQPKNGRLRQPLPAVQQQISSDYAEEKRCASTQPSSHLNHQNWRAIGDELHLSARQLQIAKCMFDGFDEPSIGRVLGLSRHTVHSHVNRLYKKIQVKSRCELMVRVFLVFLSRQSETRKQTCSLAQEPLCVLAASLTLTGGGELATRVV